MTTSPQIAVVFPGQGTQRPGMGKDFFDGIPESRRVFEEASDALGWNVADLCFGEDDRLNLTEYAQPAILTTEIAMLRGIEGRYDFHPRFFGGHSLGEYTALVAAGALPFAETLKVVHTRGHLMQEAAPLGTGAMAAVISPRLDLEAVQRAIRNLPIDVANDNSADQVVISGEKGAMPAAERSLAGELAGEGPFRFVALNVSAPFHSRFMRTVQELFRDALEFLRRYLVPDRAVSVTSNFTGNFHLEEMHKVIEHLTLQLSNTVRWRDNMKALSQRSGTIIEIGPGRPLRDFFRTIDVTCRSITTLSSAERMFKPG